MEDIERALFTDPPFDNWLIFSGPNNWAWDNVFDWIRSAVDDILAFVHDIIANSNFSLLQGFLDQISYVGRTIGSSIASIPDVVESLIDWYWELSSAAFGQTWAKLTGGFTFLWDITARSFETVSYALDAGNTWLFDQLSTGLAAAVGGISDSFSWFFGEIAGQIAGLPGLVTAGITAGLDTLWSGFLGLFKDFPSWVGGLMDAVVDWFNVDIPGHSPRWHGIFTWPFDFLRTWLYEFPKYFFGDFPENVAYGLNESFSWIGDTLSAVFDAFWMNINRLIGVKPKNSVEDAPARFSHIAQVGWTTLSALVGMTVAGELLTPLKRIGLGQFAAILWDTTHYKDITGAYMKNFVRTALDVPLHHYFNDQFRPEVLPMRDFLQLMSRGAFTAPELLRNEALTDSVHHLEVELAGNPVSTLIGYYGLPAAYEGLYRELAYQRLGYFALAGIARTGFWDEDWFTEALARTGYSITARDALMRMYREQVTQARILPISSYVRRGVRDGYFTQETAQELLDKAAETSSLSDTRLMAIGLEKEIVDKDTAVNVILQAFARGIIDEGACAEALGNSIVDGDTLSLRIMETKIGLVRRISITSPEPASNVLEVVEE